MGSLLNCEGGLDPGSRYYQSKFHGLLSVPAPVAPSPMEDLSPPVEAAIEAPVVPERREASYASVASLIDV